MLLSAGVAKQVTVTAVAFVLLALQPGISHAKKIDGDRLLAGDRLLEIRIRLPTADWNELCKQARNPGALFDGGSIDNPYTYFKADIWIDGVKIESVGVRKKGFAGSLDSQRPSLKVKFDEFVKQDPIKGLSRLTLNNNKQDTSQLSQFLTYRVFRDADIYAPRCNLALVTVNDEYLGVYSNVESIKKPFLAHNFGDKTGNLYEGMLTDFHPRTIKKIEVKTNKKENDRSEIARLATLLAADGELQVSQLGKIIDVDYFVRYWAIEGMTRFWDGYTSNQNNFYFYINPKNGLGYFIPWGADWALSNGGPFGFSANGNTAVYAQSILANRLYNTEGVPERYRAEMLRLLDEVWNEKSLRAEVDRLEDLITPHLHDRQQDTPGAMTHVRDFIDSRRGELLKELENWPAQVPNEPRKPMYIVAVGVASGSFTTAWSDRAPADAADVGEADIELKLDGKVVAFEKMGVSAQSFQFFGFGGPGGGGPPSGALRGPGPPGNFKPPVNLNYTGIRAADGERVTVSLFVDRDAFETRLDDEIDVMGSVTEGRGGGFGFGRGANRSVRGTLRLTKSGTTVGDAITGSINLNIVEFHGGLFNQRWAPAGQLGPGGAGRGQRPQRPGRPAADRAPPAKPALLRALDANRDGKLSTDEIEQASAALKRLDRNGDGELTGDELESSP